MSKGHSINMLRLVTSAKFLLFDCGAERTSMLAGLPFISMDWLPRKGVSNLLPSWCALGVTNSVDSGRTGCSCVNTVQIHKVIQCGASPHQMKWIVWGSILIHFCIL